MGNKVPFKSTLLTLWFASEIIGLKICFTFFFKIMFEKNKLQKNLIRNKKKFEILFVPLIMKVV